MDPKAFPHQGYTDRHGDSQGYDEGMSLRDYFAAKAMQAAMIGPWKGSPMENTAQHAYRVADAMMKAREACAR